MKNTYIAPEMEVVELKAHQPLLTGSMPVYDETINSSEVL